MTREEMLQKLGISDQDFTDLVNKITALRNSLNDAQRAVFDRSLPTLQEFTQAFGPNATLSDVHSLIGHAVVPEGVVCFIWGREKE